MTSRQAVCDSCVSICQVPKSLSRDEVTKILINTLRGRVLDLVSVARIDQDRTLTRWVVWLESIEDVRYLLKSKKEDRIEVEESVFTVTYERTDPWDIPDDWLKVENSVRESQHFYNETEGPTHRPPVSPRRSAQNPDSIKRGHLDKQNVQHPPNPPHIARYYQSVSPNAQTEVKQTNVDVDFEQQQTSPNFRSNQYYLGQGNPLQHGGIPSQMIPNIPSGNTPVSFAQAAMVGQISSENFPQISIQRNRNAQFDQQPLFYPNMMPFGIPPYFSPLAPGIPAGYNVSFAGKTTPQFPNPQSGYSTAGFPLSSVQPNQPGPVVEDATKRSEDVDDEDELDRADEDDIAHEKEQYIKEVENKPTRILVSNLPSSTHEEYLEMFFESKKTFGVQVKNVELDEETNSAIVEFNDSSDVDVVLGKGHVKMMDQFVEIEVYTPEPREALCTIQVRGPPAIMQQTETLEMYFESKKKSNGGNVQHIHYDSEEDVLYVSFETEEIAQRVLEKPRHTVNKMNLQVQLYNPKSNKKKLQNKTKNNEELAEETTKVQEPVCSVKVGGVKALPSRETFEFYFENERRSGGGEIEEIQTDEEDEDIVYIKYKSEKVARTVAEKSHVLEEHELDVSLYVPPKPLPSYDNKVLIKGLNPKTTQECLSNFIEAKSGFTTESMIRHTQQDDVVMVTMETDRDFTFEKLETVIANAKLEGNTLKIARVPITDCIIVYNLSDDMTAETIQYYFENQRRSGGGHVRKVVMNEDNTCLVYFIDFKTIESVLRKQHTLSKEVLTVQKYQECLARPEGKLIERKLNIPAPLMLNNVDPEKIKFINSSNVNKEMIRRELKKVHADIIWPRESGHVELKCTLTKEDKNCFKLVKTWKTEALRIFEDLIKNIVLRKIDVLQDIWENVREKLHTVSVSKPEDAAVFVEKKLGMITVAGKKTESDEIARRLNEIKDNAMAELEKKRQTVTENVTGLKPLETKLLLICRFPNEMKKEFNGLKVNINTKTNKVMFEGSLSNVQSAKLKMYEMRNRFQFKIYKNISQMKQMLFVSDKTKEFIVETLKSRLVTAAWEVQQSGELVVCFDGDNAEDVVTSLICESVKESDIALRDESKPLTNSKQWFSEIENLNSTFEGKCIVKVSEDTSKVIICATEDILVEVVDSVKKFLRLNTVLVEKVSRSRNAHRLIEKHHKDVLCKISDDLNDQSVHVIPLENYEGFEVRGTQYGIQNAKIQLGKLLDEIKFREHTMDKPGLSSHMDTPKGKDSLNTIESILHCTITVKKVSGEDQAKNDGNWKSSRRPVRDGRASHPAPPVPKPRSSKQQQVDDILLGNVRVSVIKGEIAKQQVDVIVNTTATNLDLTQGFTSASLLKAGGPELQQEVRANFPNGIQYGEIAITSGKKLKCHLVIHSSLAAWDGNNAETCKEALEKLMKDCLDEAEKQNFTSIAFPAIGTGKLGYPRDVVASSLFNTAGKFTAKSLQDVRFVVYQRDYSTVQAFENELAKYQKSLARQSRKFNLYEDMHKERGSSYVNTDHDDDDDDDDDEHTYEVIYPTDVKDQDYKIGDISVVVKQGDITEENADCIVNSSNEALDLTRGAVSKAILKKGGRSLAEELAKLRKKMRQNHFVVSSAKGMPCKKIIHVVARETCEEWKQVVIKCLDEAERLSFNSIAFPALGTGIQMKASEIALTMISAVMEFETSKPQSLTKILFVIYQKEMVEEFLKAVSGAKRKGKGWSIGGIVQAVKGIFPWSSSHGDETYGGPEVNNNNKVTFVINAMSEGIIDKAVDKLESILEREVEKKVFKDSIIRKMDDNQLMEIRAIARQHHLNLTLEEKRGYMEISGIASNIMTASDKIYRIIRDAVTLEQQQNSADILSNIVQWYFIEISQIDQKLLPYDKDLNFKIENAYKSKEKQVEFTADNVTYILNFKNMEEYPKNDTTDIVSVIRRDLIKQSSFGAFEPPGTWADMTGNLRVVTLQPGTPEYQRILQTFAATSGGSFTVNKIERVQNKTLWQQYQAKQKQLENQNPQGTQNEMLLWHGTASDSIDNINAHGFNRSYCGKNAVAYGNGVYFAVNASYSCGGYSQPDANGVKRVYYCRVLTGEYTTGTYGMRVPPQKAGAARSTDLYDSVVDNPAGPSMFIIFHDTQAYPEYLLSFK